MCGGISDQMQRLYRKEEYGMILRVPSYYKEFTCIADKCQDSCCIGWKIDIDEDTVSYYKSVEGTFGRKLTEHMTTEEGNSFVLQENGWCPFLNGKKLCEICLQLGEEALSEVCTEYPRFTLEYASVREKVLCLSCEEVGRLVFQSDQKLKWEEQLLPENYGFAEESSDKVDDEEEIAAEQLEAVRDAAIKILQDRTKPLFMRAAEYLVYCSRMQKELFGSREIGDTPEDSADSMTDIAGITEKSVSNLVAPTAYHEFLERMKCFEELEALDDVWTDLKQELYDSFCEEDYLESQRAFLEKQKEREYEYEHLLVYFTFRYFMRAYYDDNILTKAQFAVASVLFIRDMDVALYQRNGGIFRLTDRIHTAKIYAKEVEHSEENMELLAEDFQFEDIFTTKRLVQQLLV